MTELIKYISRFVKISDSDIALINNLFRYMSVSKGTIIEKENTFVKKLYYLRDGYLRVFINNDGEEATTQIVGKQNFVTSFESFVTGKLAQNNIKTVTDCEMLYNEHLI